MEKETDVHISLNNSWKNAENLFRIGLNNLPGRITKRVCQKLYIFAVFLKTGCDKPYTFKQIHRVDQISQNFHQCLRVQHLTFRFSFSTIRFG